MHSMRFAEEKAALVIQLKARRFLRRRKALNTAVLAIQRFFRGRRKAEAVTDEKEKEAAKAGGEDMMRDE